MRHGLPMAGIQPQKAAASLPLPWGERLSCLSSVLPWFLVSDYGVEDGEAFACDGDEGDHFRLSGGDEAVEEGFQYGIVPGSGHGADEQDAAHARHRFMSVGLGKA